MKRARIVMSLLVLWAFSPGLLAGGASQSVVGTYANLSFNVNGAGGQNRLMPRLELHADGTYRWGSESGTYQYRGGKLYLSGSHSSWGPGRVDQDMKIWFDFTKGGKHFTVTMYRAAD
ncbi:MAG TPA: hypothetical protein VGW33_05160 [Terriglobia bacterium]|nr:hypothetical protein [Terriglobia bacterium]